MLRVEDLEYPARACTNKSVLLVGHVRKGSSVPCMKKKKIEEEEEEFSLQLNGSICASYGFV